MQFFDTHAHIGLLYDDPARQFRAIQEAKMAGVTRIMSINNNLFDFKKEYAMLKTVKGICPEFTFGTPSMLVSVQEETGWAGEFFVYTVTHGCNPDFLNLHYYDNSLFDEDSRKIGFYRRTMFLLLFIIGQREKIF